MEKKYKFPKTMGACADRLYAIRQKRLAAQKEVDAIESEEKALKDYIIDNLPKSDTGASGKVARVSVGTKEIPTVEDWDVFYKYVARTKSFDLLQRRLSDSAIKERWENKKRVPGIGVFVNVVVSLNKL